MDEEIEQMVRKGVYESLGKGPRSKVSLERFSMEERDWIARWIESKYEKLPLRIAQAELYMREHPDDNGLQNQAAYWRAAVAVSKQLAFLARSTRSRKRQEGDRPSA